MSYFASLVGQEDAQQQNQGVNCVQSANKVQVVTGHTGPHLVMHHHLPGHVNLLKYIPTTSITTADTGTHSIAHSERLREDTKVTKRAAMPARFVTNEVVTNHAGIALFSFPLGYQYI